MGDVFVVLPALDGVEHESRGAGEGDTGEEGGGSREAAGGMGVDLHWVIEVAGGADCAVVQGSAMGENGVADVVAAWRELVSGLVHAVKSYGRTKTYPYQHAHLAPLERAIATDA